MLCRVGNMSPNNCTFLWVYKILAYLSRLIPKQQYKMNTITHPFYVNYMKMLFLTP